MGALKPKQVSALEQPGTRGVRLWGPPPPRLAAAQAATSLDDVP